jgi:hypothetical protein
MLTHIIYLVFEIVINQAIFEHNDGDDQKKNKKNQSNV